MAQALQRLRSADQQQLGVGMAIKELAAGRQRDLGAVVATHAIDSQNNHARSAQIPRQE